jgi:integrase
MPLKLYKRPSGIFHIRGVVQGRRVDESAKTRNRGEAEEVRAKLEADLFKRAIYGDDAVATFAEAAEGYMLAGGERAHLAPILVKIGNKKLADITQATVDALAAARPSAAPATLLRQIYTPISAVMMFASSDAGGRLCRKIEFRKPVVRNARVDYLTPDQAEAWIVALPPHLSRLITFYLATGCRASEALGLEWKDVSLKLERVVFWDTKMNYPRGVDLQRRARRALEATGAPKSGAARAGRVFLNSRGEPWHSYDAINLMLKRHRGKPGNEGLVPAHCHLFRHTWATWAYACTRDLTFLMAQGGWRSLTMVGRYTHAGSPDLARAVKARKWEFGGREIAALRPRRQKR